MDIDSDTVVMSKCYVQHLREVMQERKAKLLSNELFYYLRPLLPAISILFKLAEFLNVTVETKYMTLELYEEFSIKYLDDCYKEARQNPDERSTRAEQLSNNTYTFYTIIACFKLASKMVGKEDALSVLQNLPNLVPRTISEITSGYDPDLIVYFEKNILKFVEYKMPLHTPVHCIEVLLVVTGMINVNSMYTYSMLALDVAYLKYETLYEQFQLFFIRKSCQDKEKLDLEVKLLKIDTLFLSAAIVLAATFEIQEASAREREEFISKLSDLSQTPAQDITVMANTLLRIMSLGV